MSWCGELAPLAHTGQSDVRNCAVTKATAADMAETGNFGNDALGTWLWPDGRVLFRTGGSGEVLPDGSLSMKFGWWRKQSGRLVLAGRRIDRVAPPMRSRIPDGYGDSGIQSTALIFPTVGCWEVTGQLNRSSLKFVTAVERE